MVALTLQELQERAHCMAKEKGFWEGSDFPPSHKDVAVKLALIHCEVSEAVEEVREYPNGRCEEPISRDKPEGLDYELADIVIRVADLAEALGIDLDGCVKFKMKYNATRSHKHNKAF